MYGLDMSTRVAAAMSSARHQRGVSIIELMVGIVVALLVGLAAAGSASVFTASQRQGIGTGGAAVNTGSALAALKNDAAAAGLGFFGDSRFLCNRLNLSVDATVHSDGAAFSPVRITSAVAGDRIDVLYATQVAAGTNVLLNAASDGTSAELRSLLPVAATQAVLLAPETPGDPCVVRTVTTNTVSTVDTRQLLAFANTGRHNAAAFTTNAGYPDKGRVTLLGELRWSRYRLDGTNLLLERPLDGTSAVLVRDVIGFRAEYGIAAAAAGSTTLESWQPASGADFAALSSAALPRVRAVRIGMVTRSPQREKPNAAGNCEASTAKPQLFGAEVEPDVSDWACYRYRTAIVVVPLRNLVMGVTP
jgi:type IV pilus assembly protein PilW